MINKKYFAVFPINKKQMIDFEEFIKFIHEFSLYYPTKDSPQITSPTRLEHIARSVVSRKRIIDTNAKIFINQFNRSIKFLKGMTDSQKNELKKRNMNIAYNLYFYEDLHFLLDISDNLKKKLSELEEGYDLMSHLRLSLVKIKQNIFMEPINNSNEYLKYLNINNKKGHRDVIFSDIRFSLMSRNDHIVQVDTKGFFNYRNSKKVKMEIESYLKTALKDIKGPHDEVVV